MRPSSPKASASRCRGSKRKCEPAGSPGFSSGGSMRIAAAIGSPSSPRIGGFVSSSTMPARSFSARRSISGMRRFRLQRGKGEHACSKGLSREKCSRVQRSGRAGPRVRANHRLGAHRLGAHRLGGSRRPDSPGGVVAAQMFAIGLAVEPFRLPLGVRGLFLLLVLLVFLLVFLGELLRFPLGFFLGFALGLLLQALPLRPRLGALLLAHLLAGLAFAADRLQIGFEIVGAVIVVDLLARLDVLDGADENLALARLDVGLRIRLAGVIDVAGDVLADRTVDGPAIVELEKVFVLDRILFFFPGIQDGSEIADDLGALLDRPGGEEAKAGLGAADAVGLVL